MGRDSQTLFKLNRSLQLLLRFRGTIILRRETVALNQFHQFLMFSQRLLQFCTEGNAAIAVAESWLWHAWQICLCACLVGHSSNDSLPPRHQVAMSRSDVQQQSPGPTTEASIRYKQIVARIIVNL